MRVALCFRIDLPIDATGNPVRFAHDRLNDLLTLLEHSGVFSANLAFSAAALACFEREGFTASLARVQGLIASCRLELLGTPAHGALLPLLPDAEVRRQIRLNDEANRKWFGDHVSPECLWPTELATSPKVATIAASLGYSSMLVDEAAMRLWPAPWPGNRIDAVAGIPGFFAIPASRAASASLLSEPLTDHRQFEAFVPPGPSALAERYVVATINLTELRRMMISGDALRRIRSVRIQDLFKDLPLNGTTNLLASSRRSTPEEVGHGLPFAAWFAPDNQRQALQWRLLGRALDLMNKLETRGLSSMPKVGRLRQALDETERESTWRTQADGHRLLQACSDDLQALDETESGEIRSLCHALGPAASAPVAN